MLIVLSASIFEEVGDDIFLLAFLQRSLSKRCYLAVGSPTGQAYSNWLDSLTPARRDAWQNQLDWTVRDQAIHRLRRVEVVANAQSEWDAVPPRLSVADALVIIDTPFRIMVENGRGDRAFLLNMATPAQRELIEYLEDQDQLIFFGNGGISELRTVLVQQVAKKKNRKLTHWVLVDSDAASPGASSQDAILTKKACLDLELQHHILQRRAIENYLPKWALYGWARSVRQDEVARTHLLDAFYRMNSDQRAHFHMKSGLPTNLRGPEAALYQSVGGKDKALLSKGFGKRIGDLFTSSDQERLQFHIDKEGAASELAGSLAALMETIRVPHG